MATLKLGLIADDKPVRLTLELPAAVHRDLAAYAELLGRETGQVIVPSQLVAPMLARFMATDRQFAKSRRARPISLFTTANMPTDVRLPVPGTRSGTA